MTRSYEYFERPPELGGWRLRMLEDGEEMGGGVLESEADAIEEGEGWVGLDPDFFEGNPEPLPTPQTPAIRPKRPTR